MKYKESNIVIVDDYDPIQESESSSVSNMCEFVNSNIESVTNFKENFRESIKVSGPSEEDASKLNESSVKRKGSFICDFCGKSFKYNSHFIIHYRRHTNDKPYCCSKCDMKFPQKSSLVKHSRVHSNERPFVCDICMCSFKTKGSLTSHKKIHIGKKLYKCKVCNKSFHTRSAVARHQLVHSVARPYVCEICNMSFKSKPTLKNHYLKHNNERKFICEICNNSFKRSSELLSHVRKHTGERPHVCEVCNKGFQTKVYLRQHLLRHTKVKEDHVCPTCNKRVRKDRLLRHIKNCKFLSEIERGHACVGCKKEFVTLRELLYHSYIHLTDNLYNCDVCGAGFDFTFNLRKHICISKG